MGGMGGGGGGFPMPGSGGGGGGGGGGGFPMPGGPPPALDPALAAFAPENMSEEEMMEAAILASLQPSPPPQGDANMDGGSDAPEGGEGGAP